MGKYKYLAKNIGLLTLSSFATKLLSFFLVPLYTNILTTTEYGTYDLFNTTIGILLPILTLNIQSAVMRFALDKKYSREALVSVSMKYLISSSLIVVVMLGINYYFGLSTTVKDYSIFFFLMYFTQALSGIVLAYIRGIDKIAVLSVSSVIASVVTITCNILFLVTFKLGLNGYFLANIIGPIVQCSYLAIKAGMPQNTHLKTKYDSEKEEMTSYSKPLIANDIAWWVNGASDKYVVTFFCGLAENGIYSVASKIPSILNIFQSIFSQAWTLSAVKDFDSEDKNGFFANTYKAYNCLMVLICSAIIVADKILAKMLYAKDFYIAWKYVPWLTIAIVFGSLSGYLGGVFSAVKNSKIFAKSSMIGAITNIVLNLIFTPFMGPLGAAIATAICYAIVWAIRFYQSKNYIRFEVNITRDIVSYIVLCIQAVVLILVSSNKALYIILICLFLVEFIIYIKDIKMLINKIINR